MINTNDFRPGMTIEVDGQVFLIIDSNHHKLVGRGGAIVRTKLRNLETGVIIDRTFNAGDKVPGAQVETTECQYLYGMDGEYHFMDMESYYQFAVSEDVLGDRIKFLKENMVVQVSRYKEPVVEVQLPVTVEIEIVETDPGLKGDTASGGSKPAKLETGATIRVPLFVGQGEIVRVDTRTGEYVGRA